MAVQPQTPYKEYTANGSTKSFALEFDCDNQDHLIVLVDDVEAIVGTWSLSNGTVVFGNAPATGKKITVQRNTPFRRDGDFQSYDNSFRPGPVNKGFDWIWLKLQELGVADWILGSRIDALKNYVDDRDDELRAYLMEEIHKQGVALDQLDDYYNYLMQRLAQIAVSRGWDASFVVDAGGSTQQDINDFGGAKWRNKAGGYALGATVKLDNGDIVKSTVDGNANDPNVNMTGWLNIGNTGDVGSIADLLAIPNPRDGSRVYVKSYNQATNFALAQPYNGGKSFTYKASLASINNQVTVINGWVWLNPSNEFTTYDVGLTEDFTGDATAKLQALFNVSQDYAKYKIMGDFITSTNLRFVNKTGVEVTGGSITGDVSTWSFGSNLQSGTTAYGLLIFDNCPQSKVTHVKITGVQKNVFGSFQAGDSGIQLYNSPYSKVTYCGIDHTFAWGVLSEQGDYVEVNYNVISDVAHQSGVSLNHGGSKHTKCNFNTIYNVGLYGVEVEDQTAFNNSKMFEVFGNVIFDCTYGIVTTGNGLCRGSICGNYLFKNSTAIWNVNSNAVQNITVNANTCTNNYKSSIVQSTLNTFVHSNIFDGKSKSDTYYKESPDALVLKLLTSNSFMMKKGIITSTGVRYINNTPYTFTAIDDYTDSSNEFSDDNGSAAQMVKVTVSETINSNIVNKIICFKKDANSYGEAVVSVTSGSEGSRIHTNIITGGLYLLFCNTEVNRTGFVGGSIF